MSEPKIPEAYSIEFEDIIDAEKAYELYWDGEISDKRAFECKNENCEALITCANIDKERVLMKKKPYFLLVGEHTCTPVSKIEENKVLVSDEHAESRKYIDDGNDILLTIEERKEKENREKQIKTADIDNADRKRKKKSESSSKGKRYSEYKTIAPIVSKYLNYSDNNLLHTKKIITNSEKILYGDFFVELDGYNCDYFINDSRIYFGDGVVKRAPKDPNEYIVEFNNVNFRGLVRRPSIYIGSSLLDDKSRKINWSKKLKLYSENDIEIKVFVYGKLKLKEKLYYEEDKKTIKNKYYSINIFLDKNDLRFWDIREVE
ncbi:hypothetical protein [Paenibacillus guangzhouensis]|uniref:hypothetical protein n=1 Tax=Paenibacillus guangzhouensis TaxID=1473112 RepID=UPI001266DFF5|nr:hypothetical protein [Paenibacillus guangzhouensis]